MQEEGWRGRDPGEPGVQPGRPAGRRCRAEALAFAVEGGPRPRRFSSAQLEARGALDGVEQLAPQQCLVLELWELQQVHAGAGRGQPLQVGAPVVNAERGIQLLEDSGCAGEG